jgi:peptidoglycan/xylan/chitin deacetylase (PgdA/CDA1 family)
MVEVIGSLRRAALRLKHKIATKALILLYHRVDELPSDPYLLGVTPEHFAEHLEVVRKQGYPVRLQELAEGLQDGHLRDRAIVITFDDGYSDNLYYAKPLLERCDIPATVFVTTKYMAHAREFWWDELAKLLLRPGTLPTVLDVKVNGTTHRYDLGEAADYVEDDYRRHRDWHVERVDDPSPRQHLFRSFYHMLFPLLEEERQQVLDQLRTRIGLNHKHGSTDRGMSPDEIIHLAKDGLVEIGAHTVTHPALATLSVDAQREEILRSKHRLEQVLGYPVRTFAYPHGSFTRETVGIVRDAGFVCAGSSEPDLVWSNANLFQLPRVAVRDWNGDTFARWLNGWFGG